MKKLKFMLPIIALALGFGVVFTQSAFKHKEPTNLAYQYTADREDGVLTPANWTQITYDPTPSECDADGELICVVQFQDDEFSNIGDFLSNYSDGAAVNSSTYAKRHKEEVAAP